MADCMMSKIWQLSSASFQLLIDMIKLMQLVRHLFCPVKLKNCPKCGHNLGAITFYAVRLIKQEGMLKKGRGWKSLLWGGGWNWKVEV